MVSSFQGKLTVLLPPHHGPTCHVLIQPHYAYAQTYMPCVYPVRSSPTMLVHRHTCHVFTMLVCTAIHAICVDPAMCLSSPTMLMHRHTCHVFIQPHYACADIHATCLLCLYARPYMTCHVFIQPHYAYAQTYMS
jgi:hypothetical protein